MSQTSRCASNELHATANGARRQIASGVRMRSNRRFYPGPELLARGQWFDSLPAATRRLRGPTVDGDQVLHASSGSRAAGVSRPRVTIGQSLPACRRVETCSWPPSPPFSALAAPWTCRMSSATANASPITVASVFAPGKMVSSLNSCSYSTRKEARICMLHQGFGRVVAVAARCYGYAGTGRLRWLRPETPCRAVRGSSEPGAQVAAASRRSSDDPTLSDGGQQSAVAIPPTAPATETTAATMELS